MGGDVDRGMTAKQIERLRRETASFGIDFEPAFFSREDDVKNVIRWAKGYEKPTTAEVRKNLLELGCHSVEHLQGIKFKLNWNWL